MPALKQTYSAQQMVSANRRFHQETAEKKAILNMRMSLRVSVPASEAIPVAMTRFQIWHFPVKMEIASAAVFFGWVWVDTLYSRNQKKDCENQKTASLRRNSTNPAVFA